MDIWQSETKQLNKQTSWADWIAHVDYASSFEELLVKDGSVTINQCNLKMLAVEMYKKFSG